MRRTMDDDWWGEFRWRIGLQIILWGIKLAPDCDARDALLDALLPWADEAGRQRDNRE